MEIDVGCCTLRSWRRDDQESLVQHANDRAVWINLRDGFPHPYTPSDASAWLGRTEDPARELQFAIAVDGKAVGGIGLAVGGDVARRSAELGYWLGRAFWGRGLATSSVRAITDRGFAALDICRIHAAVFEWNPASARVLEKAGFTLEGRLRKSVIKDGKTIDSLLYALIREKGAPFFG